MAYRDDRDTRRAHIARLEDELARLESDEASIRALPGHGRLQDRLLGGPRALEHAFVFEGSFEDVVDAARDLYEIDGRVAIETDASIWRAEPEPRPRRVEVRATRRPDGALDVVVKDEGSYRAYLALFGMVGMVGQVANADVWFFIYVVVALALAAGLRNAIQKQTRRRAWQARLLERRLSEVEPVRVRVADLEAEPSEADAPEELEAVQPVPVREATS